MQSPSRLRRPIQGSGTTETKRTVAGTRTEGQERVAFHSASQPLIADKLLDKLRAQAEVADFCGEMFHPEGDGHRRGEVDDRYRRTSDMLRASLGSRTRGVDDSLSPTKGSPKSSGATSFFCPTPQGHGGATSIGCESPLRRGHTPRAFESPQRRATFGYSSPSRLGSRAVAGAASPKTTGRAASPKSPKAKPSSAQSQSLLSNAVRASQHRLRDLAVRETQETEHVAGGADAIVASNAISAGGGGIKADPRLWRCLGSAKVAMEGDLSARGAENERDDLPLGAEWSTWVAMRSLRSR